MSDPKPPSRLLTEKEQAEIAALREQYDVTHRMIAARTRGRNRHRSRVDRSLVSKVLAGRAVSRHVLRETYKILVARGWQPRGRPSWLPETVREVGRAAMALGVVVSASVLMALLVG